ncbi:hypothetical protein [Vulcanococcus sp.]|uniref:hypothetical protein n=1 Tax=Vulcanococcus sp. TaxID=2856995 RepID=UPI003F698219
MQPFVASPELQFREEATRRVLQELFDANDLQGLMDAAVLLNKLWIQQTAIARWLANEAAENLGEAWDASRLK